MEMNWQYKIFKTKTLGQNICSIGIKLNLRRHCIVISFGDVNLIVIDHW